MELSKALAIKIYNVKKGYDVDHHPFDMEYIIMSHLCVCKSSIFEIGTPLLAKYVTSSAPHQMRYLTIEPSFEARSVRECVSL